MRLQVRVQEGNEKGRMIDIERKGCIGDKRHGCMEMESIVE